MLGRLLRSSDDLAPRAPRTPEGTRLYAIGDIHGRADLLLRLHELVRDDAAGCSGRRVLIYLGDYVDRGLQSRAVIDLLLDGTPDGFETHHLMGNHEELMSAFLEDVSAWEIWMFNGGDATLLSYGVDAPAGPLDGTGTEAMQQGFRKALPEAHRAFLRGLALCHIEGDYLFTHAGLRPGVAPDEQAPHDLRWIREPFLSSTADHGYCVVHGHTIVPEPEFHPNRIAIDTGAYYTNRLTCLVLEGEDRRVLQT